MPIKYSQSNARIRCELGTIVNLGIDIGAANAKVSLEIDVPKDVHIEDLENDLIDELEEWLQEATKAAIDGVIEARTITVSGK